MKCLIVSDNTILKNTLSGLLEFRDRLEFHQSKSFLDGFDIYISDSAKPAQEHQYFTLLSKPIKLSDVVTFLESCVNNQSMIIKFGDLNFIQHKKSISTNGTTLHLTDSEAKVLLALIQSNNIGISKHDLTVQALSYAVDAETSAIDNHINNLREKLASIGSNCRIVVSDSIYRICDSSH